MPEYPSFSGSPKAQYAPKSLAQPNMLNGLELGEIDSLGGSLMKYRADIRLFNGEILKKVRLPGPFVGILGFLSGFKLGYRKRQMVLVGFLQNRRDNPIVIQVYPFAAETKGRNSLAAHSTQYDTEETAIGDESGHRTAWTKDKVQFIDKLFQTFFQIDYQAKKITLKVDPTTKVEIEPGKIRFTAPFIYANNGSVEINIPTHKHATAIPGPPIEPTPGT